MKAIKLYDDVHTRLTGILGLLMAKSRKPQTYADAVRALTIQAVLLPEEMMSHIGEVIADKDLGYTTPEEFVKDAIRDKLETIAKNKRSSKPDAMEKH